MSVCIEELDVATLDMNFESKMTIEEIRHDVILDSMIPMKKPSKKLKLHYIESYKMLLNM